MTMNPEHMLSLEQVWHWILQEGLGTRGGTIIPYPSAEYVRYNLTQAQNENPLYQKMSQTFEKNAGLKGNKTWELLAHWYAEGLIVDKYEESLANPLQNASVKVNNLRVFLKKSRYAIPVRFKGLMGATAGTQLAAESQPSTKELHSLYRLVLGMVIAKYDYDPKSSRNLATGKNAGSISADLQEAGFNVSAGTIRKILESAYAETPPDSKS